MNELEHRTSWKGSEESQEAERLSTRPRILKPLSKLGKETSEQRQGSQRPSLCTYVGEVQAQLELFTQPLASVIVGTCGREDGVKQTSQGQPSFSRNLPRSQWQGPRQVDLASEPLSLIPGWGRG